MRTIVITGGAGFVGSNLATLFKRDNPGSRIVCLDNLKRRGSELNLPRLKSAGVEFVHGDIRWAGDLETLPRYDLLLECSAEPSVQAGYGDSPAYVVQTNLVGTLHCLESARKNKAAVIFLSTSRVYPIEPLRRLKLRDAGSRFELDDRQETPGASAAGISEDFPLHGARSLYGATKLASELMVLEYLSMYGLQGLVDRAGIIAGPWQMGKVDQGVVAFWTARHMFKQDLAYIGFEGTGKQVRDFMHVEDLYRLLVLQLKDLAKHTGQVYNVGGGRENSFSLQELTEVCRKVTGNRVKIKAVPETHQADVPCYLSDARRVRQATGWAPKLDLEKTVAQTADWIAANEKQLRGILS